MASFFLETITEKRAWEAGVAAYPEANFLQSWNWGEFHQRLGHPTYRLGFYQGKQLKGVLLGIVEKAKRATYLTVPGGPLIDWSKQTLVQLFKQAVVDIAKRENCSFVRVRPQIEATPENYRLFAGLSFRPAPMHLHAELTHQLDLGLNEDRLLAGMRKATRYEIRRAEKLAIVVTASTDSGHIDSFYELQMQTAQRHDFVGFGRKYLLEQFKVFAANNQALLYTARLQKQVLAQAVVIFYGQEADYHYGASSEMGRKYPGSYAIQWAAIKEAKRRGMRRYNFWGVAPIDQPQHRFYGVSVFKRGFGGQDVHYLPAHDLVINWSGYTVNFIVETVRKHSRGL